MQCKVFLPNKDSQLFEILFGNCLWSSGRQGRGKNSLHAYAGQTCQYRQQDLSDPYHENIVKRNRNRI